ncbi:hypothetical protein KAU51_05110 [Candidatus Parcubacteria bacterium]|nr:hypothetical protein [Candidatus Parcubacteria bacterium]
MEHRCSYCNSIFVSVVVGIPKTTEKICKGCLLKMIEKIDNTIIGKLTSKPLFKN